MKTKFSTPFLFFFISITFLNGQEKVDSFPQLENEFGSIDSRKHHLHGKENIGDGKLLINFFVRPSTATLSHKYCTLKQFIQLKNPKYYEKKLL